MDDESPSVAATPQPSLIQLFLVFVGVALSGFGGVLPFARRALVEQRRWMTPEEFNDAFAICQMLPGPNIVNMAAVFGSRIHGLAGAVLAFLGMLGPPVVIVLVLATLYVHVGDLEVLQRMLSGISAVGVGLFGATALKMAAPLAKRRDALPWAVLGIVFVAIAVFRLPMPIVLVVVVPLNILLVWRLQS